MVTRKVYREGKRAAGYDFYIKEKGRKINIKHSGSIKGLKVYTDNAGKYQYVVVDGKKIGLNFAGMTY